jgi:hypothetical protein
LTKVLTALVNNPTEIGAWRGNHARLLAAVKSQAQK